MKSIMLASLPGTKLWCTSSEAAYASEKPILIAEPAEVAGANALKESHPKGHTQLHASLYPAGGIAAAPVWILGLINKRLEQRSLSVRLSRSIS